MASVKLVTCNYLDDFLFLQETEEKCNRLVRTFLKVCKKVGVPVATEKTEWTNEIIIFLGLLLDGVKFVINILQEKKVKAMNNLKSMLSRKKATVNEMEKLAGLLNFLSKAVVPGRAFTRQMYTKFCNTVQEKNLRKFHHINLDFEYKSDCKMWLSFLKKSHYISIARPFCDLDNVLNAQVLYMYSDATKNSKLGFGNIFNENWISQQWEPGFIEKFDSSIEFLELYAVCMGIFTWIEQLRNLRFIVFCNNISAVNMLNHTTSGCRFCMVLVRILTLKLIDYNCRIFSRHVKGSLNKFSDALSRLEFKNFWKTAKRQKRHFNKHGTKPLSELWPLSKFWSEHCVNLK